MGPHGHHLFDTGPAAAPQEVPLPYASLVVFQLFGLFQYKW